MKILYVRIGTYVLQKHFAGKEKGLSFCGILLPKKKENFKHEKAPTTDNKHKHKSDCVLGLNLISAIMFLSFCSIHIHQDQIDADHH